jgi:hypothetical protein
MLPTNTGHCCHRGQYHTNMSSTVVDADPQAPPNKRRRLSRGEPARIGLAATVYTGRAEHPARVARVSKGKKKVIELEYRSHPEADQQGPVLRQRFSLRLDNMWVRMGVRMDKRGPRALVWAPDSALQPAAAAAAEAEAATHTVVPPKRDASAQTDGALWWDPEDVILHQLPPWDARRDPDWTPIGYALGECPAEWSLGEPFWN